MPFELSEDDVRLVVDALRQLETYSRRGFAENLSATPAGVMRARIGRFVEKMEQLARVRAVFGDTEPIKINPR